MEMLKLLATAAVLMALTPQWVDSTTISIPHGKGHVVMKVGCSTNWWGVVPAADISLPHPKVMYVCSLLKFHNTSFCEQLYMDANQTTYPRSP